GVDGRPAVREKYGTNGAKNTSSSNSRSTRSSSTDSLRTSSGRTASHKLQRESAASNNSHPFRPPVELILPRTSPAPVRTRDETCCAATTEPKTISGGIARRRSELLLGG